MAFLSNTQWAHPCRLLVKPSQTLQLPIRIPVFMGCLLWSFGWRWSPSIWETANNLDFYKYLIVTSLGSSHAGFSKLYNGELALKGNPNSSEEIHVERRMPLCCRGGLPGVEIIGCFLRFFRVKIFKEVDQWVATSRRSDCDVLWTLCSLAQGQEHPHMGVFVEKD